MAVQARYTSLVALIGFLGLAGCQEGSLPFGPKTAEAPEDGAAETAKATVTETVEEDVASPDVFSATEEGLWDGRPSLGRLWIAHPDAKSAERVRITNKKNGKTLMGQLFRREGGQPGPRIQVSSEAAAALGMLAGEPALLEVVAIRREAREIVVEVPVEDLPDGSTEDSKAGAAPKKAKAQDGAIQTTALDPIASAGAAITKAEAKTAQELAPPAQKQKKTAAKPAPVKTQTQAAKPAPTSAPAAAPADASASDLRQPFIQVGTFTVEANAEGTAAKLRKAGLIPAIRKENGGAKPYWRVVVGPATSSRDRRAILKSVRDLGFEDAYFVRN